MTPQEARAAANVIGTQLQHEWMTTAKVIEAIPDANKDWKPEPKSRSAWELAVHLAGADIWFLDSILNGKFASAELKALGVDRDGVEEFVVTDGATEFTTPRLGVYAWIDLKVR